MCTYTHACLNNHEQDPVTKSAWKPKMLCDIFLWSLVKSAEGLENRGYWLLKVSMFLCEEMAFFI